MKEVDYSTLLSKEDQVRIMFRKKRGKIVHFIVQYSALINGRWRSIMRIDTCHNYAHKHTFHLKGKQYILNLTKKGDDLGQVFTLASKDIKDNFQKIKANFLQK